MLGNGRGLIKALENWAKNVTAGYRDVHVRDLSTSFRDGLAFCAIIHHYRPDLIDFDSLSKENIFENNSLAFSVAEKQLGVPALLDAEDMVAYPQPDRLSIITYLSQLRNCFVNQNKVTKRPDLKRIPRSSQAGPPAKVSLIESPRPSILRHEVCQVCRNRVFILERLIVDGKLYHTTCFRCHKCNTLLNPGAYVEGDVTGTYECSVCLIDEVPDSSLESVPNSPKEERKQNVFMPPPTGRNIDLPEKDFVSKETVNFAKSNLFQDASDFTVLKVKEENSGLVQDERKALGISSSIRDRINAFEKSQGNERTSTSLNLSASVTRLRPSPVSSNCDETPSPVPSPRFSLISAKSSVKHDSESEKESLSYELAKELEPNEKFSSSNQEAFPKAVTSSVPLEKRNEKEILSEFEVNSIRHSRTGDSYDSVSGGNFPEVPNIDSSISAKSNESSVSSIRTSTHSPKLTRDIFKSSLQPLKLNLPSSRMRKEPSSSQTTSSSESEKLSIDIPQIKSSYSTTLPRSGFERSLSGVKQLPEIKTSSSECNLSCHGSPQTRRSSLESGADSSAKESKNKTLLQTSLRSFQRATSSIEIGSSEDANGEKAGLKNYTPIYKTLYSTLSLTDRISSKMGSDDALLPHSTPKIAQQESGGSDSESKNSTANFGRQSEKDNVGARDLGQVAAEQKMGTEESKAGEEEDYPDDLNPFGDEENDQNEEEEEYPDDLNPFGDDDEEEVISSSNTTAVDYDESKNPFASDEDEPEPSKDGSIYSPNTTQVPYMNNSISSNLSSPSGSLKGTIKKRPAPRPPKVSDIFPKDAGDSGIDSSFGSTRASSPSVTKKNFQTSSPKVRKNKPAPPPPAVQDPAADVKLTKETDNRKLKAEEDKPKKKKKRPAPPVPITIRRDQKKIPLKEIMQEMKEIEEKQREYERQGREIELLIRDRDKDEEPSVEEEEYIMQLFELVNHKNALFRRQAELMYIKRSQRLEEQQSQIEKEIRRLMEKPESEKTEEDRRKEEELTMDLIDIVDQRNSIIDSIEMDRRRELEEDHSVQEQLEMKNGDLPITAEIKQKSSKTKEKKKEKKEKKKKKQAEAEESSGKGTLRKKNLFSKRS